MTPLKQSLYRRAESMERDLRTSWEQQNTLPTAVEAARSMFCLRKAVSDNRPSPWKQAKLLLMSSLKRCCRAQNEKGLA